MFAETIIEKLKKIQVMAERGTEHEREVAAEKLDVLLKKHRISIDELSDKRNLEFGFKTKNKYYKTLLLNIAMHVINVKTISYSSSLNGYIYIWMTKLQSIQVKELYDFYRPIWGKEFTKGVDLLMESFCIKNRLYSNVEADDNDGGSSDPMDMEKFRVITAMMRNMNTVPRPAKQIETGLV